MLDHVTYTDKGTRNVNEDSACVSQIGDMAVFAVCDGLGGHSNGDLASKTAVNAICSALNENTSIDSFISDAMDCAQADLLKEQENNPSAKKNENHSSGSLYRRKILQLRSHWRFQTVFFHQNRRKNENRRSQHTSDPCPDRRDRG